MDKMFLKEQTTGDYNVPEAESLQASRISKCNQQPECYNNNWEGNKKTKRIITRRDYKYKQ